MLNHGPDGRLYLGSQKNMIYAIRVNRDHVVVNGSSSKDLSSGRPRGWVLRIASTAFWKKNS